MPSGAELERFKLLKALGLEGVPGIDGARLSQIVDSYLPVFSDAEGNLVGIAGQTNTGVLVLGSGDVVPPGTPAGTVIIRGT